jgi:NAD+ kinase
MKPASPDPRRRSRASEAPARNSYERIAFVASPIAEAQEALQKLASRYGNVPAERADVVVALGGDGLMLQTLHKFMHSGKPIYGMYRGTVGFLMDEFREDGLRERLAAARVTLIHPLLMHACTVAGAIVEHHAFN